MANTKSKPAPPNKRKKIKVSLGQRIPPFSGYLWKLIHYDEIISVGDIAEALDISPKTVYGWSEGRGKPSIEQMSKLFRITELQELIEYFISGTEWLIVHPEQITESTSKVSVQALDIMDLAGRMACEIKKSMSHSIITQDEKKNIHDRIQPLLQSLLALDASLLPEGYQREQK